MYFIRLEFICFLISKTDLTNLKFYCLKGFQTSLVASDLSNDSMKAFDKAVDFINSNLGVRVTTIRLPRLRKMMSAWMALMKNGEPASDSFGKLLNDSEVPINPYFEFIKSFLGIQKHHTLPAIGLALTERFETNNGDKFIEEAKLIREQLQTFLGYLSLNFEDKRTNKLLFELR